MAEESKLEQIQKKRKDNIDSLEKNLKNSFYLDVLGVNDLRKEHSLYGSLGESIGEGQYTGVMTGEDATQLRNKIYRKEMESRDKFGITDMPDYPSNYQITEYVLGIQNESIGGLPLASLEKILGETAKGFKLNVPKQLKEYEAAKQSSIESYLAAGMDKEEIEKRLKEESRVDEDSEKAITGLRQDAYFALRRGAAFRVMDAHKFDDLNGGAKKISDAYKKAKGIEEPKEEDKPAA